MKKKTFFAFALILLVFVIGFVLWKVFVTDNEPAVGSDSALTNQDVAISETEPYDKVVEISLDSVNGITQEEAEKLCYSVLGEKNEETGFTYSFGVSGAVKAKGKQYYVIRASWLVNNSHLSYIGDFFVSADGKELYSGTALQDEYIMEKLIWEE